MKTIVNKPWGHEEIWAQTNDYVGKILFIKEGQRLSLQYHKIKEETIRVLSGTLEVIYNCPGDGGCKNKILKAGETFHVSPLMVHRFCASQGTDVELIEVSTNHLHDVERLDDDYSRI